LYLYYLSTIVAIVDCCLLTVLQKISGLQYFLLQLQRRFVFSDFFLIGSVGVGFERKQIEKVGSLINLI